MRETTQYIRRSRASSPLHIHPLSYSHTHRITTKYTYTTRADGPRLCFVVSMNETVASNYVMIKKVSARALNYRAQVQDFHLRDSYGMRNARYDGCKLTATDYNVDSPDTIDGGPVIQITLGTGVELTNQPTTRGNFTIR